MEEASKSRDRDLGSERVLASLEAAVTALDSSDDEPLIRSTGRNVMRRVEATVPAPGPASTLSVLDESIPAPEAVPSTQPASVRTWVDSPARLVGRPEVFPLTGSSEEAAVCRQPQSMRVAGSPRSIPDREIDVQFQDLVDARIGATVEETPVVSPEAMGGEGSREGDIGALMQQSDVCEDVCLTPTSL